MFPKEEAEKEEKEEKEGEEQAEKRSRAAILRLGGTGGGVRCMH